MKPLQRDTRENAGKTAAITLLLLLASGNATAAEPSAPVWGVFHSIHTTISDGSMSQDQRAAELKTYYDWASTVDHAGSISAGEWTNMKAEAGSNNTDGSFTYFAGYEWRGASAGNAEVVVFFEDDGPASFVTGSEADYDTFSELTTWLEANNGMGTINHPARSGNAVDWSNSGANNASRLPCVEMLNKHYYHWNDYWNCSSGSGCTTYANPSPDGSTWSGGVLRALERGLHLCFVGGWDYHGAPTTPYSYTGLVNPPNWTRGGVFDTVRRRHTWAADDKIIMDVTASNGTDAFVMGDEFRTTLTSMCINYTINAASGNTIDNVSIFFDGVITNLTRFSSQDASGCSNAVLGDDNEHFVFFEAVQSNGDRAWSSPMYITRVINRPNVTLNSPGNGSNQSSNRAVFNYTASNENTLANATLYLGKETISEAEQAAAVTWIANRTIWKYNDSDAYAGDGWDTLGFDDSPWKSGYDYLATSGETVGEGVNTTLDMGTYPYGTYYFRRNFTVSNASRIINMSLNIDYDDAYAVWLNGNPVESVDWSCDWTSHSAICGTLHNSLIDTSGASSPQWPRVDLNSSLLANLSDGVNVMAVAVKQYTSTSSDAAFRLHLRGYESQTVNQSTSTWHANRTRGLGGTSNTSSFKVVLENNATYIWNVLVYDNEGQSSFAGANRTLRTNAAAPAAGGGGRATTTTLAAATTTTLRQADATPATATTSTTVRETTTTTAPASTTTTTTATTTTAKTAATTSTTGTTLPQPEPGTLLGSLADLIKSIMDWLKSLA